MAELILLHCFVPAKDCARDKLADVICDVLCLFALMNAWMDGQITNGCFRLAAAAAAQGKRILSLSLPETRSLHSLLLVASMSM